MYSKHIRQFSATVEQRQHFTDGEIGTFPGTFDEYLKDNWLTGLMVEVQPIRHGNRIASLNVNGGVFIAVERDGCVDQYNISNGATR